MADIFLSYAREDLAWASRLATALAKHSWTVFWDRRIPTGKSFDQVIEHELDAARCVIVLWSQHSISSDWVKGEASEGARRGILYPVLVEDVRIPLEFRRLQSARLVDWQPGAQHAEFDQLLTDITVALRPAPVAPGRTTEPEPPGSAPMASFRREAIAEGGTEAAGYPTGQAGPADEPGSIPHKWRYWLLLGAIAASVSLLVAIGVMTFTRQEATQTLTTAPPTTPPAKQEATTLPGPAASPAKGGEGRQRPKGIFFGNYHALVIGNSEYRLLRPLATAVNDAREVAATLKQQYGFKATLLLNATRYDILSALNTLRGRLTEQDNLLIYYAGHGEIDRANRRGNWLPVDADPNNSANWIPNTSITDILNAMSVRQLLVVADSSYAGTITRSAPGRLEAGTSEEERMRAFEAMARKRSRMVLTSGGMEPVLDSVGGAHSAFAQSFLELLKTNEGVLPAQELFRRLQLRMAQRADLQQVPEYAPIQFAGHEAGDFFFVRADKQ